MSAEFRGTSWLWRHGREPDRASVLPTLIELLIGCVM